MTKSTHYAKFNNELPEPAKRLAELLGYTFRRFETDEDLVEQMVRPDGTIAVEARRKKVKET